MKVIKEGKIPNSERITCKKCNSELKYDRNDVRCIFGDIFIVCPICNEAIEIY